MSIGYSRKKGIRSAAVFFLAAFLLLSMMSPAWADDTYYATWADFQKSGNPAQTWNDVTNAMDAVLDTARQKFKDGDFDGAYDCVNDAYYGYYETTGFERIAMGYISGARKSEMELQFSACKAVCKDKGSEDDFNKEADKLSSMLHEDANVLDGTSGDSGSSDEDKETLATRLFADKYYANYTEYQKAAEAEGLTEITWNDVVDAMTEVIRTAKQKYADGDAEGAYDCINDGYYGYYEITGFERIAMGYISGSRKSEMELQFSSCKSVTKEGGSTDVFDAECDKLVDMLRHDAHVLDGTSETESGEGGTTQKSGGRSAAAAKFIACFSIVLREGFEAILVVGAIIAYLLKMNEDKEKKERDRMVHPVYWGSILGIILSFISAWVFNLIKVANSASQEIIEGVTALVAVVVLYYVSNWMLSKSETESWKKYIKSKVGDSTKKGSVFALAFTAFLAVYREGAEVVLFFQPMLSDGKNINMVWLGLAVGGIALVGVYIAIHVMSVRFPLKPFFIGTSILMFIMSISFLGGGIKELIEGDVLTMHSPAWVSWIPANPVLEVLGIYPCVETIVPQLILLVITIIVFVAQMKKNKKLREEVQKEEEGR